MTDAPTLLEVRGLTVRFAVPAGELIAVDDVSYRIAAGRTLGVVGESGSGKTVTALALLGLLPPNGGVTDGAVLWLGSDLVGLARFVRARIGGQYKVLPTAVFAAAMRPSIGRRDLEGRIDRLIEELAARHANLGVTSGRQAVEEAAEPLELRGIVVFERGRFRVRERSVLRYYGRTIEHLLATAGRTH